MMNKFLTLALVLLVFACKTPEARRPVSVKTKKKLRLKK